MYWHFIIHFVSGSVYELEKNHHCHQHGEFSLKNSQNFLTFQTCFPCWRRKGDLISIILVVFNKGYASHQLVIILIYYCVLYVRGVFIKMRGQLFSVNILKLLSNGKFKIVQHKLLCISNQNRQNNFYTCYD